MTQTTKNVKVTFTEGELPGGTHATFKKDGELWVAWPMKKHQAHLVVTDRLLGALTRVKRECLTWLNDFPQDATRVARVIGIIRYSKHMYDENVLAKVEVATS